MGSLVALLARRAAPDRAVVARAAEAAQHRGPVKATLARGRCVLAVTETVELPESHVADERDLTVVFTGHLDNVEALAKSLADGGTPAAAEDPASVVAALLRRDGDACFAQLRGAFAVAATDGDRLWALRDQVGYRPLYLRDDPGGFLVATEAKQVVAGAGIAKEPDLDVVTRIFYGNYGDDTPSALSGVARLPKGHVVRADERGTTRSRYWRPERVLESGRYTPDEVQERFDELMAQATSRMLTGADAVSLSGGVDSPAIAAYAAPAFERRFGRPLPALTAVYPDLPTVDESAWVQIVVDALGMELHTYRRDAPQLDRIREWADRFDGPVPVFPPADAESHYRTAAGLGLRNVMNGAVAELVFDMRSHLLGHLLRRRRFGPLVQHIGVQRAKGVGVGSIAKQLGAAFVPGPLYAERLRRRPPRRGDRVPPWVDIARVNERVVEHAGPAGDRWRRAQLGGIVGPGLSAEANEVVQEVCGVRARYPWADVDVWEFFLSLPAEVKFPDGRSKGLVRQLLRGRVPDPILDRREKTVFNDAAEASIDYDTLIRWVTEPPDRIAGVNYELLAERLATGDMRVFEYVWAKDLATVHAFLDLWGPG